MQIIPIDVMILIFLVLETVLFLIFHIVVIRQIGDRGLFIWLLKEFFSVMAIGIITQCILLSMQPPAVIILTVFTTQVLYGYLAMMYVQAIFGITLTSLRIQLLTEIYQQPTKRLKMKDILKKYNRDTLVRARIFRLKSSGEIQMTNGKYALSKKISPFRLHMRIVEFLYRLYN